MLKPSPEKLLALGMSFWNAKTLLSAVELGVFDALADGPAELATLTTKLGLHKRSAHDFFDALVAMKVLERDAAGRYANTPETEFFLVRGRPSYVGGLLEMANARLYESWGRLSEALKTGRRQSEDQDASDLFAALYADPQRLRGFLSAMSGVSAGAAQAIADKFSWRDYRTFVDVGAAQGMVSRHDRASASASFGRRLRSSPSRTDIRGICRRQRARGATAVLSRRLFQGRSAPSRRHHHGAHPS